ncbi:MAG: hypothetical protein H6836_09855 [Planctomycetes bacterium]|nr:hypothetical protein [Planctomycetota bacterium]
MRRSILFSATVVLAVACSTLPRGLPHEPLDSLPWSADADDQAVMQARAMFEQGQPKEALTAIEAVLERHPAHVDALRVRQDILRDRGRRGLLLHEVQEQLAANPEDPLANYLAGRLRRGDRARQQNFAAAVQAAPSSLWSWFGLAHSLRETDTARSLAIYAALYEASHRHPIVGVSYAAVLLRNKQPELAAAIYDHMRGDERVPGVGDLGLAQAMVALDRRDAAWAGLLAALRVRPFDPGVHSLLHAWLETGVSIDQERQVLDILREDPARLAAFASESGTQLLVDILVRGMQPQAALSLLEAGPDLAHRPAWRRLQRRLLLALGEVDRFVQLVIEDVPEALVAAEGNRLRGRWLTLLRGPWRDGAALADAGRARDLAAALLAVGWLQEVELLVDVAERRLGDAAAPLLPLRDEARRELAFEAGLRRLLYLGYRDEDTAAVETVLERIRELSLRVLQRDVVGRPTVFSLPMIGELVDPFTGALAEHFDRYNRHFVLGRRSGGTAEGMLFVRLSLADLPDSEVLDLPGRCLEVVAIDRDVRALAGVLGGDLAGVALLNHFLVDYDAVRDWARSIADRRRIAREDGGALANDPLPDADPDDPLDVSWRLSLMSSVQDSDLEAAVLDTIRHHERQHLVDSFHYLPVEANVWRALGLVFSFGLSPSAIEAEMERRAELAALVVSEHTELVLAHIADFLGEAGLDSPHHHGFGDLARQLREKLATLGVPAENCAPSRWHLVPRQKVREAARLLLAELRGG